MTRNALWHRFTRLTAKADLPSIRLHDLRHCAASLGLTAGTDLKVISETLGHRHHSFTADTYTNLMPESDREAADAVFDIIPRRVA